MPLALLLTLQAAAAPAAPVQTDFDLATYRPSHAPGCGTVAGSDILVCGRRLNQGTGVSPELERRYGWKGPVRAEVDLGEGVTGRAYTESKDMGRGAVSKRILIGVKTVF